MGDFKPLWDAIKLVVIVWVWIFLFFDSCAH